MIEWAQQASTVWQYLVLFLLSIAPWMDVSIVVPLGIVWGLPPIAVGLIAFFGNLILILLLALFFKQFSMWRTKKTIEKRYY